jgi:hypothetical protein
LPTFNALVFGARVRGRNEEAIGSDQIEMERGAAEALAGRPGALSRLRSVAPNLEPSSETAQPIEAPSPASAPFVTELQPALR